jgi:hypothetical protein
MATTTWNPTEIAMVAASGIEGFTGNYLKDHYPCETVAKNRRDT